ncbi:MAG: hydrolase 2, exosortase A system-associated [Gallionellaceae bacterium]
MHDAAIRIEPFFLGSPRGQLFCLYLAPADKEASQGILYLHPFAEEMHKSRRMAALQARAFARAGFAVLQVDLTGCGDSAGDFGDAAWEAWRDDAQLAHAWLAGNVSGPITLWGLRIGASLAVDIAPSLANLSRLLLWQPVANGDQYLTQFLRIKLASEMLSEGQAQSGTQELRAKLDAGQPIEIGGYMLAPDLARGLAKLKLAELPPTCAVEWIDVGAAPSDDIAPAGRRIVEAWRTAGTSVHTHTVRGETFWSTQEITECAQLVEITMKVMAQ